MNSAEEIIIQRLQKIKSWADINKFSYEQQEGKGKVFSIFRKNRGRLITFYKESIYKGVIYVYVAKDTFPGDELERKAFINELQKIDLLSANINPHHNHLRKNFMTLKMMRK